MLIIILVKEFFFFFFLITTEIEIDIFKRLFESNSQPNKMYCTTLLVLFYYPISAYIKKNPHQHKTNTYQGYLRN